MHDGTRGKPQPLEPVHHPRPGIGVSDPNDVAPSRWQVVECAHRQAPHGLASQLVVDESDHLDAGGDARVQGLPTEAARPCDVEPHRPNLEAASQRQRKATAADRPYACPVRPPRTRTTAA